MDRLKAHIPARPAHAKRIVAVIVACAVGMLTPGCADYGHDSDRNSTDSDTELFLQAFDGMSPGKRLYWLGPSFDGYFLTYAVAAGAAGQGVDVRYGGSDGSMHVVTFEGPQRPTGGDVIGKRRIVRRFLTPDGQLIVLCVATAESPPTRSAIASFVRALRPVSRKAIEALPDNWQEIA
jgi:hypothetical protein